MWEYHNFMHRNVVFDWDLHWSLSTFLRTCILHMKAAGAVNCSVVSYGPLGLFQNRLPNLLPPEQPKVCALMVFRGRGSKWELEHLLEMIWRALEPTLWNWCKPGKEVGAVSPNVMGFSLPRVHPWSSGEDSVKLTSICSEPGRLQLVTSGARLLAARYTDFPGPVYPTSLSFWLTR